MSAPSVTTASITPELFPARVVRANGRALIAAALCLFTLAGLGLRVYRLGAESLSEDELNKVKAVAEYREKGLTPANGEHPFLMKAMLAASIIVSERWNDLAPARNNPQLRISTETAARLPGALLGALSGLLIFFVTRELFGVEVALVAAALWALDPAAIGFNRIAKEDSFLLFFFLLGNVFWLRGQTIAEEGRRRPEPFYWAAAAAFGAMLASKYVPHYFAITAAYYYAFQGDPRTRWRVGKRKWMVFFAVMALAFLVCNPTILLPGTWQEMRVFAREGRIGHDSYEFLGHLYRNQMTLWLQGSPWYFYFTFVGVKLATPVVVAFIVGLPQLFRKRLGDGRYFIFFWLFFWFFPFTFMGGKFTRYVTFVMPAVLITAAVGVYAAAGLLSRVISRQGVDGRARAYACSALALVVLASSAYASLSASPHYRLYTSALGGGWERAGDYFPHDEFYDASTREIMEEVARLAAPGARVASETPELTAYYARLAGREDLRELSLSDRAAVREMREGDVIVVARGRRYFSNDELTASLRRTSKPKATVSLGRVPSAEIYVLDAESLAALTEAATR
ncbi:MAG: glycosyltransferase family 39 protein [Pyrinomonadaceae bacterium]